MAYSHDENVRINSSSGGIFTELAEYIINLGGVVFGCALDERMYSRHIMVKEKQDLSKLRGSKYVQSEIGNTYILCKELLQKGKKVLFTGTPCQIEGLYRYLQCASDKNIVRNLYTQDLICHGVPSPDVWKKYLDVLKRKNNGSEIVDVKFRDKSKGWKNFSLKVRFLNGVLIKETWSENSFLKGFFE